MLTRARFFEKFNVCFPVFDEVLFRRLLSSQRGEISPALLSTLYGNTLTFWNASVKLARFPCPSQYSLWVQAEDALMVRARQTSLHNAGSLLF
jgi:hypothetical protein